MHGFTQAKEETNVFNLGVESTTEVTRVGELVVEEMGLQNVNFKYTGGNRGWKGDVPHFQFDISKIKNIGWQPKRTSDEAVRKAIQDLLKTL